MLQAVLLVLLARTTLACICNADRGDGDADLPSLAAPKGKAGSEVEVLSTTTLQYRPVWLSLMMTGELGCMGWLGLLGLMGT